MKKKKVVYLSAGFGQGHISAVEAVWQSIDKHYPNKFDHQIIDVAALLGKRLDKAAEFLYEKSIMYAKPTYKAFFELTDAFSLGDFDKNIYPLIRSSLSEVTDAKPDVVIACYPMLAYSVSRFMKETGSKVPFVTLITDTGEVHNNWLSKEIDHYIAPTIDTGFFLEERGVPSEKVKVLGFPVKQDFYKEWSKASSRKLHKIKKDHKVILYFPGAWGTGRVKTKLYALDRELKHGKYTVLVVCGKNKQLKKSLESLKFKNDFKILGFVENVAQTFAACDLIVAKAGGISVMEMITAKKPMIITEINPGQEEPNARFIEAMGFGYVETKPTDMAKRVKFVLGTSDINRLERNLKEYSLNNRADHKIASFINSITK